MSTESKWDDFSSELKSEISHAVHNGHESFIPSPLVRAEAYEHTRDGGIFSSSTLSHPDDHDLPESDSPAMSLPSEQLLISDKIAEHVRSLPQDNSPYEDGAVLQGERPLSEREVPYTD